MKKIVVFHGWEANSESNWFPWLKNIGENSGYEVIIPNLPEPEAPILSDWVVTARKASGELAPGDIVIGHSMGGKAALHFIEKNDISGVTVILVAPTYDTIEDEIDLGDPPEVKQKLRDFNEVSLDFKKLNALGNTYFILLSDNDRFINESSAKRYYSQLENARFVIFPQAGHFLGRDGFSEFPQLLEYIDKKTD